MWKLIYSVNKKLLDEYGYPLYEYGFPESVEGNTINETISNLLKNLEEDDILDDLVNSYAKEGLTFNTNDIDNINDNDITIISFDKIKRSIDCEINKFTQFKDLVEKRKNKNKKDRAFKIAMKNLKEERNKEKESEERRQLIYLINKYLT